MIKIIDKTFKLINKLSNNFFTFKYRHKFSKDLNKTSRAFDHSELGIIIQGNIADPDFLIETIKIYRDKIFPRSQIIVSTWSDESTIILEKLKNLTPRIKVIISDKPKNCGIANINYQIFSTSKGVL